MKTLIEPVLASLLRKRLGACALGLALALPGLLPAATVEDRLAALEKLVADQAAEISSLKRELGYTKKADAPKEAPASVPPVLVRPAGKETKYVLGGFIQAVGETGGEPDSRYAGVDDRFLLRRARLNFTATFAEHFSAKLEADFGANSIATGSGVRGGVTDGFVQWNRYPEATFRLGQFKSPFGFEQLTSDPKTYTIERGLASDRLTVSRQIGAALSGDLAEKRVSYSVGVFNGNGVNTGLNDNNDFMLAGRVNGVILEGGGDQKFTWTGGVNAFTSDDTGTFTGRRDGLGFDTQFAMGPAEIAAEWLQNERKPAVGATTKADGWSLIGAWRFDPRWRGVLRFDTYDSNTAVGNTETDLWTFGVDYMLKGDDLRLTLNYMVGDQPDPVGRDDRLVGRIQVVF